MGGAGDGMSSGSRGRYLGGGISEQKEEGEEGVGSGHSGPYFTLGEMGAVRLQRGKWASK